MSTSRYNAITHSKKLQEAGLSLSIAQVQAEQLQDLVNNDLVTRSFLSGELKLLETSMIKWMVGISFSQIALIITLIKLI